MARATSKRRLSAEERREQERAVHRLIDYRCFVGRLAAGDDLTEGDQKDLVAIMDAVGLPSHALRRDIKAALLWSDADLLRRAELLNDHPHLFDDVDAWLQVWWVHRGSQRRDEATVDRIKPRKGEVLRRAMEAVAANPTASTSEIAIAADCGLGTAGLALKKYRENAAAG